MPRPQKLNIVYSCIQNRNITLVSHQEVPINFDHLTVDVEHLVSELPISSIEQKFAFPHHEFQVHVLVERGIVYVCITDCTDSNDCQYLPFSFLRRVRDVFCEQPSLVSRSYHACEDELDRDFAPVLKNIMVEFNSGKGDAVLEVLEQVEDVKQIMIQTVEKMMDRAERLDDLVQKSEGLETQGREFRCRARVIHTRARCKNIKLWLVIITILAIVITVGVLFSCGII